MGRVLGVDVSGWQGQINWLKTAQAGAWFAFIKATEGAGGTDSTFARNWANSRGLVLRGAYHFFRTGQDPVEQADHFADVVLGTNDPGELPPVLDLEVDGATWAQVAAFMDRVQARFDREPILYTSKGVTDLMGPPPRTWPLWVANYGVPQPFLPVGWDTWVFWQHTDEGPGAKFGVSSRHIDLNWFNGSLRDLFAFAGMDLPEATWWRMGRLERLLGMGGDVPEQPAEPERRRVTVWLLRVRSGPGLGYDTVGLVRKGDVVTVYETRTGDGLEWGRIGDQRWIALAYTEPA